MKDTKVTTMADILAMQDEAIISRKQVEQATGVCNVTVLRWLKAGKLQGTKTCDAPNGKFLIEVGSVKDLLGRRGK